MSTSPDARPAPRDRLHLLDQPRIPRDANPVRWSRFPRQARPTRLKIRARSPSAGSIVAASVASHLSRGLKTPVSVVRSRPWAPSLHIEWAAGSVVLDLEPQEAVDGIERPQDSWW